MKPAPIQTPLKVDRKTGLVYISDARAWVQWFREIQESLNQSGVDSLTSEVLEDAPAGDVSGRAQQDAQLDFETGGYSPPDVLDFEQALTRLQAQIEELRAQFGFLDDSRRTGEDVILGDTKAVYFGNPAVDGTWRILRSGNNLVIERLETGSWVTKSTISA